MAAECLSGKAKDSDVFIRLNKALTLERVTALAELWEAAIKTAEMVRLNSDKERVAKDIREGADPAAIHVRAATAKAVLLTNGLAAALTKLEELS
jgi:hypothetical protein